LAPRQYSLYALSTFRVGDPRSSPSLLTVSSSDSVFSWVDVGSGFVVFILAWCSWGCCMRTPVTAVPVHTSYRQSASSAKAVTPGSNYVSILYMQNGAVCRNNGLAPPEGLRATRFLSSKRKSITNWKGNLAHHTCRNDPVS
jgi:hypothetical protein